MCALAARVAALAFLVAVSGCYASHARYDGGAELDASVLDASVLDASSEARDAPGCGCPCSDRARACLGAPATPVTLALGPRGETTLHRSRAMPIALTFDPEVAYPDLYEAAVRDWMRDCPTAFAIEGPTEQTHLPGFACENAIHFAPVGAVDASWGTCSGAESAAGYTGASLTGEIYETCIEIGARPAYGGILRALGQAMGIAFVEPEIDSIMANPIGSRTTLSELDHEGFCAAYGGAGWCTGE